MIKIGNSRWLPGTFLPIDHHGNYRITPIVFILSEHVAKYEYMPYGWSLVKIGYSKWPPEGCLRMKTIHIGIYFGFCKYGWILLKFDIHVSLGYGIIRNESLHFAILKE